MASCKRDGRMPTMMELAARLNAAPNRKTLAFDRVVADFYRYLHLPPGGVPLAGFDAVAAFGKALNGGRKAGCPRCAIPQASGRSAARYCIDTLAVPPELLLDVEWPGAALPMFLVHDAQPGAFRRASGCSLPRPEGERRRSSSPLIPKSRCATAGAGEEAVVGR